MCLVIQISETAISTDCSRKYDVKNSKNLDGMSSENLFSIKLGPRKTNGYKKKKNREKMF